MEGKKNANDPGNKDVLDLGNSRVLYWVIY